MPLFQELFAAHARQTPARPAVVCGPVTWTYGELHTYATRIARRLGDAGVGPESLVGLLLPRSADWLAAVIGVWQCGAAYVPLDPSWPAARLQRLLREARVAAVIARAPVLAAFENSSDYGTCLDITACLSESLPASLPDSQPESLPESLSESPSESLSASLSGAHTGRDPAPDVALPRSYDPATLAYVIYTSGSTGAPKGVMIEHRALANLIAALRAKVYRGLGDAPLHIAVNGPLVFDTSVKQIVQLACGHTLHIVEDAARLDPAVLAAFCRDAAIDVLDGTPTQVGHWLSAGLFTDRPPLPRVVLVGGEAIDDSLWRQLRDRAAATGTAFFNLYGPTECCVDTLISPIGRRHLYPRLGSVIRGARVHVLSPDLTAASAGTIGELHIAGAGLARGYLHQPRLTAERFVPDPFGAPGDRLYRSGDLVRQRPGGELVSAGRVDHQIKLRGFRIEPGEIEAALRQQPDIADALVILREDRPGEPRLVAYVLTRAIDAMETGPARMRALREQLGASLPDYLVPSAIVSLAAWPRTANGKLDRAALPAPAYDDSAPSRAPRTPVEETLAAIWLDVLALSNLGIDDDFFERGGHSLLMAQVAARVRDALHCDLPLAALFDQPTIAGMADLVTAASRRLDLAEPAATAALTAIPRVARRDDHPVSFAQERIWFLHRLAPASVAYVFRTTIDWHGTLAVHALERALTTIVSRHEILRTTFFEIDGRPRQRVHPPWTVSLPIVDLSTDPEAPRALEALLSAECRRGFEPSLLPLVRWTLVRVAPDEHVLIHVDHHLVHDGWSFNVLLGELSALYTAFAAGASSPLPDLPIQFIDFCEWQHAWLHGEDAAQQMRYWVRALDGAAPLLRLPLDRPRPAVQTFAGAIVREELPADLAERLRAVGRREHATLFMTMMTAFTVLLGQYTGQSDLCVGSTVANRRRRETEPLLGMIVNNVVIRTRLDGDPTFAALLRDVRATTLDAYMHQDAPFDALVQALRPTAQVSHNPLFQVAFSFHDAPLCDLRLPGMQLAVTDLIDNGSAKFDMNVVVIPRREQGVGHRATAADGITVIWEYNTDLFDPDTVRAMIDRYVRLLDAVAAAPARRLSELTALDQRELDRLHAWNDTRTPISRSGLLQAFAAMVQATPGAPAIVTRDEHLTYSDLDRRSNRLARFLVESGHAPDTVIGLSMRRSARVLTTLLGVLKAGAAYLPLDPDLPPRRLAAVLDDAQARLLLTDASFAHAGAIATPILDLEREWPRIEMCSDIALSRPFDAQAPAYVIYTSGSTGRPKGVAVSHGALANALAGLRAVIRPTRRDRMFAVTSLAFDIAALELFVPLITGASCWIASRTIGGGATVLDEWAASGATLLQATPSGWRALLDQGWTGGPALKAMSGGEPLPAALARELLRHSGSLLNLYGPTETTIYSTTHRVGPLDAPISIGRPIANTHTYVVDRLLQPVPPGAIGELVIGGTSVALGYWRRPGATAAAFVPDLFAHAPGRRLYRTGDLVRQHRDGTFEFIGRRDAQLKVHGYRIEPGEIEAALRDQPGIHDAVVVARGDGHDAQLVAYIVTDAPPADDQRPARTAALVALLKTRLPDYMVPRAMVWLDALPLTLSGKVNRAALPAPAPPAAHIAVAPRTPTEAAMAAIWREVLGSDEVGVHDHFFALGGHSLIALQIVSRTWRALGVEIPLQVVFDSPTIAEMAIVVDQYRSAESAATLAS